MLCTPEGVDRNRHRRLVAVAPADLWDCLHTGLAPLRLEYELIPRPEAAASSSDPYGLIDLSQALTPRPAGILLIAPTGRSPARLMPSPVLHGVPVGIAQAESAAQLKPWLHALSATHRAVQGTVWAVLAMWKELYLIWGKRFVQWMQRGVHDKEVEVQAWFADTVSRQDLCQRLAAGPQLAVYVGHGRSRGWSGYRGLRWEHVVAVEMRQPCGVLISLACDTLKRTRGVFPFGCQWVSEGRSCSYVGSADRVGYEANAAFAHELGQMFARRHCQTIGQLLREVYEHLEQKPELKKARRAFLTYRLIGNPLQALY
jgi:hypothetical protein